MQYMLIHRKMITLALVLILGFFASDFRERGLKRKGYLLEDIVSASSEENAELKFLIKRK